ncbi:hypothetical protein B0H14DRAFT_3125742 [Mycena olivaceomarginata]|nr:hypothetical protein B0H14DRAFT_3125742 [Mycena olivaceomarginata]
MQEEQGDVAWIRQAAAAVTASDGLEFQQCVVELGPETPYKDYLYSNFVPSDDECSRIRDLVGPRDRGARENEGRLEKTRDGSQDSLDRMARKRDQLQEFIDSHLALVSGARRLPHDVLGEIFMACLAPNTYSSMKATESPLVPFPDLQRLAKIGNLHASTLGFTVHSACLVYPRQGGRNRLSAKISSAALSTLLSEFPMLQKLLLHCPRKSLSTGTKSCKLFKVLTPQPKSANEILCPHLQNICSLGFNVGSDEELLALIDARQTTKGIQPLSSVNIAFTRGRSVDILPRLPSDLTVDLRYPTRDEFRGNQTWPRPSGPP